MNRPSVFARGLLVRLTPSRVELVESLSELLDRLEVEVDGGEAHPGYEIQGAELRSNFFTNSNARDLGLAQVEDRTLHALARLPQRGGADRALLAGLLNPCENLQLVERLPPPVPLSRLPSRLTTIGSRSSIRS
jgi:hypothetical protein